MTPVINHQPSVRASWPVRLLGVLALLAGIVAMHAGVFVVTAHGTGHAVTATEHPMAAPDTQHPGAQNSGAQDNGCAGDGCESGHGGSHGCVFILVAMALAIGLVLLVWLAVDRPGAGGTLPRHWRPRRARPPPWTVLSLAELSILRI